MNRAPIERCPIGGLTRFHWAPTVRAVEEDRIAIVFDQWTEPELRQTRCTTRRPASMKSHQLATANKKINGSSYGASVAPGSRSTNTPQSGHQMGIANSVHGQLPGS